MRVTWLILVVFTSELSVTFGSRRWLLHNAHHSERRRLESGIFDSSVIHLNVTQPIDHQNPQLGTWTQRAQYNPTYYKQNSNGAVVFLMIGGEGTTSDVWVTANYSYIRWAQTYGAAVFQLEHRFFGYSRPYNNMKTSSLKYCTIAQALEDIASFITQMNQKYNFNNAKWVTFGGSYPGALNAWFRLKYPKLTVGAVASSAIIDFKFDFFEYSLVLERTLKQTSEECRDKTQIAFETVIQKSLSAAGRDELNRVFRLDPHFNETGLELRDLHNLIFNLFSLFWQVIQYTYDGRNDITKNGFDAKHLCEQITNSSLTGQPLQQIKALIDWEDGFLQSGYKESFPNSYDEMLVDLKNETYDDETNAETAAARGWYWLCCNEMGFMMSTDQGKNAFGDLLPLNFFVDMCTDMFGDEMTIEVLRNNNKQAREKYPGPDTYNATNAILPSGSLDPWSSVGANRNVSSQHLYALLIEGAAHCSDMYPAYQGEPSAIAPARDMIEREIQYYIGYVQSTTPTTPKGQATTPKGASSLSMSSFNGLIFAAFALLLR